MIEIYCDLLDELCWSTCGNFLQGNDAKTGQVVVLDLSQYMPPPAARPVQALKGTSHSTAPAPEMSLAAILTPRDQSTEDKTDVIMHGAEASEVALVQNAGIPVFKASPSGLSLSSLQQNESTNSSVVLKNVSASGMVSKSNLMRLPKSSTLEKSYSTLVNTGDDDKLRLVLNMAAQETYDVEEKPDFALPAVFDRKVSSIEVVEEQGSGMQGLVLGTYESVDSQTLKVIEDKKASDDGEEP